MKATLFVATMIFTFLAAGCASDICNIDTQGNYSLSRHPAELALYEIPLSTHPHALGLVDMVVTGVRGHMADIVIQNNSDWNIYGDYRHTVEFFSGGKWLSVLLNEYIAFPAMITRDIPPGDSMALTVVLPNHIPFPPPYSMPLEVGRYRVRRSVWLRDVYIDGHHYTETHEVVAEFYITD